MNQPKWKFTLINSTPFHLPARMSKTNPATAKPLEEKLRQTKKLERGENSFCGNNFNNAIILFLGDSIN